MGFFFFKGAPSMPRNQEIQPFHHDPSTRAINTYNEAGHFQGAGRRGWHWVGTLPIPITKSGDLKIHHFEWYLPGKMGIFHGDFLGATGENPVSPRLSAFRFF